MIILPEDLFESAHRFLEHDSHQISIVCHGSEKIAIECETCNQTLISFRKHKTTYDPRKCDSDSAEPRLSHFSIPASLSH